MKSGALLNTYCVWAVTSHGARLSATVRAGLGCSDIYLPDRLVETVPKAIGFAKLKETIVSLFSRYKGHIFIMSTGIVVRIIAPLLVRKTKDPAVVVMDEKGRHVISLVSGHLGGANELAEKIAKIVRGTPVITTATDTHGLAGFDLLAHAKGLTIENPDAIKTVNMALLNGEKICLIDPYNYFAEFSSENGLVPVSMTDQATNSNAGIYIGDEVIDTPLHFLNLRPPLLVAGIGCNRGTKASEIRDFLDEVFMRFKFSLKSLWKLASIDIKQDEDGLLELSRDLNIPIEFFSSKDLEKVTGLITPSEMVKKYVGVKGVCEAAAMLAANTNNLLVPKQKTRNVTIAVARASSVSSA